MTDNASRIDLLAAAIIGLEAVELVADRPELRKRLLIASLDRAYPLNDARVMRAICSYLPEV